MRRTRSTGRVEQIDTQHEQQQQIQQLDPQINKRKNVDQLQNLPTKRLKRANHHIEKKIEEPKPKKHLSEKKQEQQDKKIQKQKKIRQPKVLKQRQSSFQPRRQKQKSPRIVQPKLKLQQQKQKSLYKMIQQLDKIKLLKKKQLQRQQQKQQTQAEPSIIDKTDRKSGNDVLVDLHFPKPNEVKVYIDSNNFPFSVTFNRTDISNNINKFYIMQILQSLSNPLQYVVYTRWGRVGLVGFKAEVGPMNIEQALDNYRAKIQEKIEHGYKKVQTTYENQRRNFYYSKREKKNTPEAESKLQPKVQNLIRLIFDIKMMNNQLKEIGYDSKRMPLGKIAQASIIKGYQSLKEIMQQLKKVKSSKQSLSEWSSRFYSHIPHDFGMKNICNYVLDSQKKVKAKLQLLQSIQDIQIFTKLLDETIQTPDINQLDANYLKLNYQISVLQKNTPNYLSIMKYVENTHAQTHNHYKIEVEAIYQITQKGDSPFKTDLGNLHMLWHGSRLTNFVGILTKGLRIAPLQAPATGYMFGKGLYFADIVSKSANYCYATKLNPIGCLLLCEVALGKPQQKFYADYYANLLSEQYNSIKGVGKSAPKDGQKMGQAFIPNGSLIATGISNTSLQYNEYVVYDVNQVRCRFLLKIKFIFK